MVYPHALPQTVPVTTDIAPDSSTGSDYARLSRRVSAAGLFERTPRYYLIRTGLLGGVLGAGIGAFFLIGDSWWALPLAALFAVLSTQIALFSHDLAHRQVFRTRRPTEIAGRIAGNLCTGLSYGWWMDKHTRHHANPNHEDLDPDVEPDILVFSERQGAASSGLTRFFGRWQAFWFYPLLTLEGLNLHYSGLRAVARPGMRGRGVEAALLLTHFAVYLTAVFTVLSPGKAVLFIAIHKGLWGIYMGSVFAPGHKGMPTLTSDDRLDFLRKQVLTTRNVRGGVFTDNAMGGLNYQIEHHLFPSMPSPHLRKAQPIVRDYCAELGLPYHETGLLGSWSEALRHLHRVGAPIRQDTRG